MVGGNQRLVVKMKPGSASCSKLAIFNKLRQNRRLQSASVENLRSLPSAISSVETSNNHLDAHLQQSQGEVLSINLNIVEKGISVAHINDKTRSKL